MKTPKFEWPPKKGSFKKTKEDFLKKTVFSEEEASNKKQTKKTKKNKK